jgi:hypothetical protein
VLVRHRMPPLCDLDALTGEPVRRGSASAVRYERARPGELVHIDVKKLGRIPEGGGWRAKGRGSRPGSLRATGYDYVHSAIDDHSRLAYAEELADEVDRRWDSQAPREVSTTMVGIDVAAIRTLPPDEAYQAIFKIWAGGNGKGAAELLKVLTATYPKDQPLAFFQAIVYRGTYGSPEGVLQKIVALNPQSPAGQCAQLTIRRVTGGSR